MRRGGSAILLLVGTGDDVGDAAGHPGMFGDWLRRLFQCVSDCDRGGGHAVYTFQF